MTTESDSKNRDQLAVQRTQLANERTLLSYLRTAIMLVISGATLFKLFEPDTQTKLIAGALIAGGGLISLLGLWRYLKMQRALKQYG